MDIEGHIAMARSIEASLLRCTSADYEMLREAFEIEMQTGTGTHLHQIAIEDLITVEVGTVKRATTRGSMYGLLGGIALGVVGSAIASNETSGDADYWNGATIGGFVGAGIGALLGHQTKEVEWERLPLYGPAYDDPPADHD